MFYNKLQGLQKQQKDIFPIQKDIFPIQKDIFPMNKKTYS